MTGLQRNLAFLLVAVNVGVHFGDLPSSIPTLGLVCVVWRWLADHYRIPCPGSWGAAVFALVAATGVWFEFGRLIGDPASPALLIIMVALKSFEVRGQRDLMIMTYLCLLLLMSKLLNIQNLAITFFLFFDVIAILALMHLYHLPGRYRGLPWRRSLRLVLQAAPLVAALFLLFPRFNFSLFPRRSDPVSSVGFSGVLRPGSVAELVQTDQVAFRAFFLSGLQPPKSRLYWRAAVLDEVDQLNWDPSPSRRKLEPRAMGENVVEIMTEGEQGHWLFTLDWPVNVLMASRYRQDQVEEATGYSYSLRAPLMPRETYAVSFLPASRDLQWDPEEVERARKIEEPSQELKNLLSKWRSARGRPHQAVLAIQTYMTENPFLYTVNPPRVKTVEQFLFESRSGFCEHYAGSVATLLRHLNIPARVVVGYHGGSPSLMNDYFLVYQRDAHAWVEYWEDERKSWTRIDPTSWIAGDRVFTVSSGLGSWGNNPLAKWLGPEYARLLVRGSLALDQLEIMWISLLLRYDFTYQKELFAKWGFNLTRGLLFLFSFMAVAISGLFFFLRMQAGGRRATEPELRYYRALCDHLARNGLPRRPMEGPLSLLSRAKTRWPGQAVLLNELFGHWIRVRYGCQPWRVQDAARWRRALKKLALAVDGPKTLS